MPTTSSWLPGSTAAKPQNNDPVIQHETFQMFQGYPCMKWHPDGMILAAGAQGHAVDVWDIKEQKVVATLLGHQGSVEDWDDGVSGCWCSLGC